MKSREVLEQTGVRILNNARTELYMAMHFMAKALDSLSYEMDLNTRRTGTDGVRIHFNPEFVFHLFIESPQKLDRLYLHMILHCLFRHMFEGDGLEKELWDLACDIQVESVLDSMDYEIINRPPGDFRGEWYEKLKAEVKVLTAERLYHYFLGNRPDLDTMHRLTMEFWKDDHQFWAILPGETEETENGGRGQNKEQQPELPEGVLPEDFDSPEGEDQREQNGQKETGRDGKQAQQGGQSGGDRPTDKNSPSGKDSPSEKDNSSGKNSPPGKNSPSGKDSGKPQGGQKNEKSPSRKEEGRSREQEEKKKYRSGTQRGLTEEEKEQASQEWKKNAERMKTELETFGREASQETGSLTWALRIQYRKHTDFREFLRSMSIEREEIKVDPDSFDFGFYNYGLELYGNMPLIEQNEYTEGRKVEDLIIAIDTSASCKETLVARFLSETAGMLSDAEGLFRNVSVRILECDDRIQKEILLKNAADMKNYAGEFHVKGGYGTDFRPVFTRVEELLRKGEILRVAGLMYFTDGFGSFPKQIPPYRTAFVFPRGEEVNDAAVPDWALKLYFRP